MKRVLVVSGTRPETIKLSPLINCFRAQGAFEWDLVVTGQHREMLDQALRLFDLEPTEDLRIMQGDQRLGDLTAHLLNGLSEVFARRKPDLVIVQGDTTSAMASALAAFYQRIPVGHVEAGLRTGDRWNPFPEEINRVYIDRVSDLCFAPTPAAASNLISEGIDQGRVYMTGNTIVDALQEMIRRLDAGGIEAQYSAELPDELRPSAWEDSGHRLVLVTGHRREHFGSDLEAICRAIGALARRNPDVRVVYPVHLNPNVQTPVYRELGDIPGVLLSGPLSYPPFLWLLNHASLVITDSGGVQEEAVSLGRPTLVTRLTTERPEGVEAGVATLVGADPDLIVSKAQAILDDPRVDRFPAGGESPFGDGHAAERITGIVTNWLADGPA